jgi:hypothetical protein
MESTKLSKERRVAETKIALDRTKSLDFKLVAYLAFNRRKSGLKQA